jgi:hypothetical protein
VAALYDHFSIGPWVGLWLALALCGLLAAAIAAWPFIIESRRLFRFAHHCLREFARIGFDHVNWSAAPEGFSQGG